MRNIFLSFSFAVCLANISVGAEANTLNEEEKRGGWTLLFDGKTSAGWQAIGKDEFPTKGWVVRDGLLVHEARGGGGDIVTKAQFDDFELAWEWRIAPGGNSGLKYNLLAANKGVGCEYQLLDDAKHPDAALHGKTRQTGGLYDVLAPADDKKLNPAGQWNDSRILVRGNHVEHWLNGRKTVAFEFGGEALKAAIGESKFKDLPLWGEKRKSPILLQDHGDEISFRNFKVRTLKDK
jgi:3-keto-disaccharide hydrolase